MNGESALIVCVGEAMVELAQRNGKWEVGYGGDTLNQAIHLARLGHEVAYLTALGSDPFAETMRKQWAREGLNLALTLHDETRTTGLYAGMVDAQGERRFTYWRGESAARCLFETRGIEQALATARHAALVSFSLISLAILLDGDRERLLDLIRDVRRNGGCVAFDGNYRPALWNSPGEARHWCDRAAGLADFGIPTLDDEVALCSPPDPQEVARSWREAGCGEVIVKLGAEGCLLPGGIVIAPPTELEPVDTSGAGDAFDAGYLSARLRGAEPREAATFAHRLAGWVVMRGGAIPPPDSAAPYAFRPGAPAA